MPDLAAIYLRVSSDAQADGASLEVQRLRCENYAQARDWAIVETFTEIESAFDGERPQFQRMLKEAEAGRFAQIVVFRADRFSRDAADAFPILKRLEKAKVRLHSTLEDMSNWLLSSITFVLAEDESRRISARVRPAKEYRAQQGYYPNKPPYGARRNPDGTLRWDPVEGGIMREAYERIGKGQSLREVCRWLKETAPRRGWQVSDLNRLLHHPIYSGRISWRGKTYEGRHEALVSLELWSQVQEALTRRYRHMVPIKGEYAVAGLLRCALCKGRLYFDRIKPDYHYFTCPNRQKRSLGGACPGVSVRADKVEAWFREEIGRLSLDEGSQQELLETLKTEREQASRESERAREGAQRRGEELRRRLDRLTERLIDGTLPREEYLRWQPRLSQDIAQAEDVLPVEAALPDLSRVEEMLKRLPTILAAGDAPALREFALLFMDGIEVNGRSHKSRGLDCRILWRSASSS